MSGAPIPCRKVLVVDDDAIVRELLSVVLGMEGYDVQLAESGEEALAMLGRPTEEVDVVLVDLHMPGVQGAELAGKLAAARTPQPLLIGMSGSNRTDVDAGSFGAFLQKPFSVEEFAKAVQAARGAAAANKEQNPAAETSVLNEDIFRRLDAMLAVAQLRELYRITVEDVLRRVRLMQDAAKRGDKPAYRAEAHAIKGGCGMVGASELSALAAKVEGGSDPGNPPFADFGDACARLQGMLDARISQKFATAPTENS